MDSRVIVSISIALACLSGCGPLGGSRDGGEDPNSTFTTSCSMPAPDLGSLHQVLFTPREGCVIPAGDSITLEQVWVTRLPIDKGTEIYAKGRFVLGSVTAAEIRMFVVYGQVADCVSGVAQAPSGAFAIWGTTASVDGETTNTINVDFAYATTSTDCRYDLHE